VYSLLGSPDIHYYAHVDSPLNFTITQKNSGYVHFLDIFVELWLGFELHPTRWPTGIFIILFFEFSRPALCFTQPPVQ